MNDFVTRPEILLCPNVPKPLHGLNPRSVKGTEWWDIVRQEAYSSTGYHCLACGVQKWEAKYHQWLEAHELYAIDYRKGRAEMIEIVPLCHFCHNYIHSGRMRMLLNSGEIDREKEIAVLKHGDEVIKPYLEQHGKRFDKLSMKYSHGDLLSLCVELGLPYVKHWIYGRSAEWGKWRLVLDKKEYKPLHESFEAWVEYYS